MYTSIKKIIPIISLLLLTQCTKVRQNEVLLESQPSIVTSEATLIGTGRFLTSDDRYGYHYKTSFKVGDTMELAGRLFPERLEIKIGDAVGNVIMQQKITIYGTPYVPAVAGDYVKLVITAAMGTGRNIPIQLTANGQTITAPPVDILEPTAPPPYLGGGKTDTTLMVDSLFRFKQLTGLGTYDRGFLGGNVSARGTICFYNKVAVYLVTPGSTPVKVLENKVEYGEAGDRFQFNGIKAAAYSWDGTEVYISGDVTDNGPNNPAFGVDPDAKPFGVMRLIKMNLATRKITLLNRSFFGGRGSIGFYDWPPLKAVTGNLDTVSIVGINIRVDAYGNLYVTNQADRRGFVDVVSRISPGGQVKTLFSTDRRYPAMLWAGINSYNFHPQTLLGYAGPTDYSTNTTLLRPAWYAFKTEEALLSYEGDRTTITTNYSDTSRVSGRYPTARSVAESMRFAYVFNSLKSAVLSTGEIVCFSFVSPMSYNMEKKIAYVYAGTEGNALIGQNEPMGNNQQVKFSGLARYVDFSSFQVLGTDEKNAIYLLRPASSGIISPDSPDSYDRIYKLYKP